MTLAFILVLTGSMYSHNLVEESNHLSHLNDNIIISLEKENYSRAQMQIDELTKRVEKFKVYYFMTDNHIEIDNIKLCIAELEIYTKKKEQADALAKANSLAFLLDHLPENTEIKYKNQLVSYRNARHLSGSDLTHHNIIKHINKVCYAVLNHNRKHYNKQTFIKCFISK